MLKRSPLVTPRETAKRSSLRPVHIAALALDPRPISDVAAGHGAEVAAGMFRGQGSPTRLNFDQLAFSALLAIAFERGADYARAGGK